MDITRELTAHHDVLRKLYKHSLSKPDAINEFIQQLVVHHTMEEKYFYDILEQEPQARNDSLEAVNEHHIIELIIKDIQRFPRDHELFSVKVESLGEYTVHHLDEEESDVFPLAQSLLNNQELAELGKLFTEAKDKLLGVVLPEIPGSIAARGND